MATSRSLIAAVSEYVDLTGRRRVALQAFARWSRREPSLTRYRSVPEVVRACREGPPTEQDRLVATMLSVAVGDTLAQLAVVASLSRHLGSAVSAWRRSGAGADDVVVLQADLVSECWAAVVDVANRLAAGEPVPPKVALALVDRARSSVRARRRRELRADARRTGLERIAELASVYAPTPAEELAYEIATAVRAGRISASAAVPTLLTRVAGYSTTEAALALGRSPTVLRAVRSRAERALVA